MSRSGRTFPHVDLSKSLQSASNFDAIPAYLIGEEMIDPQLRSNRFAGGDDKDENSATLMDFATKINDIVNCYAEMDTVEILETFFGQNPLTALIETAPDELTQEPLKFIDFFAVTVICSDHDPTNQFKGGSLDEWTRFQHKCRYHVYSCNKTFDRVPEENRHSVGCKYISEEAAAGGTSKVASPRHFECEKCGKNYDRKDSLLAHVKKCGISCTTKPCPEKIAIQQSSSRLKEDII